MTPEERLQSNDNTIQDTIISNQKYGIILWKSHFNIITENTISDNKQGIVLHRSCSNIISNNTLSGNNYGIRFRYGADNNIITNNCILNNKKGVYLGNHNSNNLLYHNSFIENKHHAHDKSSSSWDNAYPLGGNYWDDYTGDDFYHGLQQDIVGSDGIGDTPYIIGGKNPPNKDRYPLMIPLVGSC